jgi:anti-sigma regulatory factor (Ser/Thr protein kinase)
MMLSVEITALPARLEFVLEDSGPKVKAKAGRSPAPDGVRSGGRAPRLIHSAVDITSYNPNSSTGNRLKLVKFLPGKTSGRD